MKRKNNRAFTRPSSSRSVSVRDISDSVGVRAFTLIELLVVVLIIGILAAIALPQYQKAVEKSRMAEALTTLASLRKALEVSKLANPGETITKDMLDVQPSSWENDNWSYDMYGNIISACRKGNNVVCERGTSQLNTQSRVTSALADAGLRAAKDCADGVGTCNFSCKAKINAGLEVGVYSLVDLGTGKICCGAANRSTALGQSICNSFNAQ